MYGASVTQYQENWIKINAMASQPLTDLSIVFNYYVDVRYAMGFYNKISTNKMNCNLLNFW